MWLPKAWVLAVAVALGVACGVVAAERLQPAEEEAQRLQLPTLAIAFVVCALTAEGALLGARLLEDAVLRLDAETRSDRSCTLVWNVAAIIACALLPLPLLLSRAAVDAPARWSCAGGCG
jgi:hypothetical protein